MAQLLKYSSLSLKYLEIQGSWAFKGGTVYIWDTVLNIEYVCDFMSHNTPDFFKTYRSIMLMVEFLEWNHAWYLLKGPYFWQFLAK